MSFILHYSSFLPTKILCFLTIKHPQITFFLHTVTVPAMVTRRILQTDIKIPPSATTGNTTDGGYTAGEDNFDNNMMIILAVLLCALICALGLNSIVRCAFRCSRRIAFETSGPPAAAGVVSKGLKVGRLTEIPVVVYLPAMKIPATDCPICLGEFAGGEKMRVLPKCKHWFHVKCIDKWLVSNSSCPICRQLLFELDEV